MQHNTPDTPERSDAMYLTPDQITALTQGNIDAAIGIARLNFATVEKLAALNFGTAKAAFEDGTSYTKALAGGTDVQELVNLNAQAGQPALEKAIAYSRSVRNRQPGERRDWPPRRAAYGRAQPDRHRLDRPVREGRPGGFGCRGRGGE